jgi:hypothetical protein
MPYTQQHPEQFRPQAPTQAAAQGNEVLTGKILVDRARQWMVNLPRYQFLRHSIKGYLDQHFERVREQIQSQALAQARFQAQYLPRLQASPGQLLFQAVFKHFVRFLVSHHLKFTLKLLGRPPLKPLVKILFSLFLELFLESFYDLLAPFLVPLLLLSVQPVLDIVVKRPLRSVRWLYVSQGTRRATLGEYS